MKVLPGINIQYPISELILNGKKTIETREYPLPKHLVGVDLAFIETPGKKGNFPARVVGTIRFSESFLYPTESAFYDDYKNHFVDRFSPHAWKRQKWGWRIEKVSIFSRPKTPPLKRGIKFTREVEI